MKGAGLVVGSARRFREDRIYILNHTWSLKISAVNRLSIKGILKTDLLRPTYNFLDRTEDEQV